MVTCEYLIGFTPGGSAGSLANTQLKFLPFLQLASITGPYGMTFLLLAFPAALAIGWHLRRTAPGQAARILGVSLGATALVLSFGAWRLARQESSSMVRVGLIASDARANMLVADTGPESIVLFGKYADAVFSLAGQGAKVVVLPEKIGVSVDGDVFAASAIFQGVANQTGITLVAGLVNVGPDFKSNQARVYEPHMLPLRYDKHHLLPSFEGQMRPGTTLTLWRKFAARWGVAICKDMDHPDDVRRYGQAGVGLMLVPAWDFDVDRGWHGHIAVMRGVEGGYSVVRAAKQGYLYASDSHGHILGQVRSDSAPFATLLAEVPTAHVSTIYSRFGDWFAWLSMVVFALTVAPLVLRRRELPPAETLQSNPAPS